jgi:ribosome-associated translation inhibitor RaiA
VRALIDELLDRLEHKLRHFPAEVVSAHALFEENGSRTLYHASLTCHIPGRLIAARKEARNPGQALRGAFAELERQLEKQNRTLRQRHLRRRSLQVRRTREAKMALDLRLLERQGG